jgi:hypothetical protein
MRLSAKLSKLMNMEFSFTLAAWFSLLLGLVTGATRLRTLLSVSDWVQSRFAVSQFAMTTSSPLIIVDPQQYASK